MAAACLAWPLASAEASPVRWNVRGRLAAQEATATNVSGVPNAWSSFLAGGEPTWASRPSPPYTTAVRLAVLRLINGDPAIAASSPLISYLSWRRSLNATRFDAYHPFIGPRLPQGFVPPTPQVIPPPPPPDEPPLVPPVPSVVPPTVPEPSVLLVILAGAAGALAMRRRRESSTVA